MSDSPVFNLESRTFSYSQNVRYFIKLLKPADAFKNDVIQLIRSSGSVGANYIEANESLSKKDFVMRLKICRKEAKESSYWLNLIGKQNNIFVEEKRMELIQESRELALIFNAVIRRTDPSTR